MVGLHYPHIFHNIIAQGNYKSRIRIYSVDLANNPIDVSNYLEVEEYGELLKYRPGDEDSNGRIGQNGIKINDYFNKDESVEVGQTVSCNIEISLINDDGYFVSYDWTQTIVVYWDVWDDTNSMWLTCQMGIYWWEKPTKVNTIMIDAKANDAVYFLGGHTGRDFPSNDDEIWSNGGITLIDFYTMFASNIPGVLTDINLRRHMPNAEVAYYKRPFDASNMSIKDVLAKIAGAAGGTLRATRNGVITIKSFTDAYWKHLSQTVYYTINGAGSTPIVKVDLAEYQVPPIDNVTSLNSKTATNVSVGGGQNKLYIVNNPLMGIDLVTTRDMASEILTEVSSLGAYYPISISCFADPSVEAGDIIRVVLNGVTYIVPIFQQVLKWNGGMWTAEISSFGLMARLPLDDSTLNEYKETSALQKLSERVDAIESRTMDIGTPSVVGGLLWDCGVVSARSVPSASYEDVSVVFYESFSVVPVVVATLNCAESVNLGSTSVSIVSVSETGCTLRINNNTTNKKTLGINWFASAHGRNSNVVGYGVVGTMTVA